MADFRHRIPQNVPGKFYIDDTCIYCDLCRELVPSVFRYEREWGWASVFHQPASPEELRLALDAAGCCPTNSIGTDGDLHHWNTLADATSVI